MIAPSYIQKEFGLINPLYFAAFDSKIGRWRVRKWLYRSLKRNWEINSVNILTICEEDDTGRNIGYMPVDMRAVLAVRHGLYNATIVKRIAMEVDAANEDMIRKDEAEHEYQLRYAAKRIWHHYQEPTVFIRR